MSSIYYSERRLFLNIVMIYQYFLFTFFWVSNCTIFIVRLQQKTNNNMGCRKMTTKKSKKYKFKKWLPRLHIS